MGYCEGGEEGEEKEEEGPCRFHRFFYYPGTKIRKKYENIFPFRCKYSKKKEKIQPEEKNTAKGKPGPLLLADSRLLLEALYIYVLPTTNKHLSAAEISMRWKFCGSEEEIFFLCGTAKSPPHSRKKSRINNMPLFADKGMLSDDKVMFSGQGSLYRFL